MAVETDKSIFYHIPKTGGTFLRVAIRNAGLKAVRSERVGSMTHESCWHTEHSSPSDAINTKGLFSSCFIRHPISWHESFWCYRLRKWTYKPRRFGRFKGPNYLSVMHNSRDPIEQCWEEDYESYIRNVIDRFPNGYLTGLYLEFVDRVDFVGKQENLLHDLIAILTLAGEEFDEEKLRGTKPVNVSSKDKEFRGLCNISKDLHNGLLGTEEDIIGKFYGSFNSDSSEK